MAWATSSKLRYYLQCRTCLSSCSCWSDCSAVHVSAVSQWFYLVLSIETAWLAARQKDSAGVAGDLLSVPGVKIWGQPVRGPGDRGPGVGFPIEDRRRDIRLALFYKAVHGLATIPTEHILIRADERTKSSHSYKFRHITAHTSVYHNSFFPRTVPDWNFLPIEAVMPTTPDLVSTVSPYPPPSI